MRKQFRREPVEQVRKTNLQVRSSAAGKREFTRMAGDLPSPDASIIYKGHKRSRRPSTPRSSAGNKKSYFSFFFSSSVFTTQRAPNAPSRGLRGRQELAYVAGVSPATAKRSSRSSGPDAHVSERTEPRLGRADFSVPPPTTAPYRIHGDWGARGEWSL